MKTIFRLRACRLAAVPACSCLGLLVSGYVYGQSAPPTQTTSAAPPGASPRTAQAAASPVYPAGGGAMNPYIGAGLRADGRTADVPQVILSREPEVATVDEMSADLRVMRHILENSLTREFSDGQTTVRMGISLWLNGSAEPSDCIYIEDVGAVFSASVNFPLIGPKLEAPANLPQPPAEDSEWERAKAELGATPPQAGTSGPAGNADWIPSAEPAMRYDAEKVRKLKRSLLRALRNASNLRHVKPEEWILVTVLGAPDQESLAAMRRSAMTALQKDPFTGSPGAVPSTWWGGNRPTVMSLRIKKEDVQSAAEAAEKDVTGGRLNEGVKSLSIITYYGPAINAGIVGGGPASPAPVSARGSYGLPSATPMTGKDPPRGQPSSR